MIATAPGEQPDTRREIDHEGTPPARPLGRAVMKYRERRAPPASLTLIALLASRPLRPLLPPAQTRVKLAGSFTAALARCCGVTVVRADRRNALTDTTDPNRSGSAATPIPIPSERAARRRPTARPVHAAPASASGTSGSEDPS